MTHIPVIGAGTRKPVLVPGASDMEFGIEFFRYQFLVTKRIMLYFLAGLSYRFAGTGFRRRFLVCVSLA